MHTLLLEEYGVSKKWVIIMDRRQDLDVTSGCRKVYAGEVFEWQKNPMEAKETIGDGSGWKYAKNQLAN